MNNNITELVFILDASGSMHELTADTIGGFNALIDKHRGDEGTVYVSTIVFNTESTVVHVRVPIADVKPLDRETYSCGGCTALIDAMGGAIHHIGNIHKYARKEDVPRKTLFMITTDGMENASRRYTAEEVKKMVRHEEEKYGWEFVFLGANIDAVETARRYGIREDRSVDYVNDSAGNAMKFATMERAVHCCMSNVSLDEGSWRAGTDADFKKRGSKKR